MTKEEKEALSKAASLFFGLVSKAFLEFAGCHVDYKINGEEITNIEKLQALDISDRIKLAIREERYEDAAKFKKILDAKAKKQLGSGDSKESKA